MKNIALTILLLGLGIFVYAQENGYDTKLNIPYYDDPVNQSDEYISERCVLDIYYPTDIKDFATIVWFHGGGLTGGNKELPGALKEKQVCIIAVNYRLYPKISSPKYIEDAAAAVAWVFNNIDNFGGDPSEIFISGHSAGGYLCMMVGLDKRWLKSNNIEANRIAGTQPVVDDLAPLYHVRADAPPLLLITGDRELELLGRYEENAYMMRMMKIAGHNQTKIYELDGYGHNMTGPAFPLLINEVRRIVEEKSVESR